MYQNPHQTKEKNCLNPKTDVVEQSNSDKIIGLPPTSGVAIEEQATWSTVYWSKMGSPKGAQLIVLIKKKCDFYDTKKSY